MTVKTGQTYRDNDPRMAGRTLKVLRIEGDDAVLEVLTNPDDVQALLSDPTPGTRGYTPRDKRGKTTTIATRRLETTTSRGYTLVEEEASTPSDVLPTPRISGPM